jgi:hypothetical protein
VSRAGTRAAAVAAALQAVIITRGGGAAAVKASGTVILVGMCCCCHAATAQLPLHLAPERRAVVRRLQTAATAAASPHAKQARHRL